MSALIAALTDKGIAKDDIATSYVSIYPTYGNNGMDITGYQAENQVDVTVRDISKVGEVIDDSVKAGANLSNGITFQLSDQNQGVDQALADAVENARSKAETLAGAGDAQLGEVVSIQEGSGSTRRRSTTVAIWLPARPARRPPRSSLRRWRRRCR